MTDKEKKLIKEYTDLRTEYDKGHSRLKWVKQRMAAITRLVVIKENIVDERPDEMYLR